MRFGYPAFRAAAILSRKLPPAVSYRLGEWIAGVCRTLSPRQRAAVGRNHRQILSHRGETASASGIRRRVRDTYRAFGTYLVDFFRYSVSASHGLEERVDIAGEDLLREALARGRGVLLATAHLGNWELGGLVLALRGYPLTAAYRPMQSPRINRLFLDQRVSRGMEPVPLGRAALSLVRALRRGRIAALLADRDFTGDPIVAPFFGAPAALPRGPATLSFRTGAPLLPAFMLRREDDRFRLAFSPPIDPGGFRSVEALQTRLTLALETAIGETPHQWFVFDDFWPGGEHAAPARPRPVAGGQTGSRP